MDKTIERLTSLPRRWHGAAAGLAAGLLWVWLGFWWLMLIVLLTAIGYFVGMWQEGDERLDEFIRRLGPDR